MCIMGNRNMLNNELPTTVVLHDFWINEVLNQWEANKATTDDISWFEKYATELSDYWY